MGVEILDILGLTGKMTQTLLVNYNDPNELQIIFVKIVRNLT